MTELQRKILEYVRDNPHHTGAHAVKSVAFSTGLPVKQVKEAWRSVSQKGYITLWKGPRAKLTPKGLDALNPAVDEIGDGKAMGGMA